MPVVPLTLTISLCLVFTFLVFFLLEHARGRVSGPERDSLLPLAEENPRPVHATVAAPARAEASHHHHASDGCGCENGSRPPCVGCLRRR